MTATNETLIQALQEQVAELTTAQTNCRVQCDNLKTRVETLESMGGELTVANSDVATKLQDLTNQYNELDASIRAINSCNCTITSITDVFRYLGITKIELVDNTLKISLYKGDEE